MRISDWSSDVCSSDLTSIHVMTPESPDTTHYFWAFGRDIHPDDEAFSAKLRVGIEYAFEEEDKPMIALQPAQVGGQDIMSMLPVLLAGHAAAVRVRPLLRQLFAHETSYAGAGARAHQVKRRRGTE